VGCGRFMHCAHGTFPGCKPHVPFALSSSSPEGCGVLGEEGRNPGNSGCVSHLLCDLHQAVDLSEPGICDNLGKVPKKQQTFVNVKILSHTAGPFYSADESVVRPAGRETNSHIFPLCKCKSLPLLSSPFLQGSSSYLHFNTWMETHSALVMAHMVSREP
jgi:hypothetical protein